MSDELKEIERLKAEFVAQFEEELRADREEIANMQKFYSQQRSDKIEAGLLDAEKLNKYVEIRKRRAEENPFEIPTINEEMQKEIEKKFEEDIIKSRSKTVLMSSGSGGWGCFLQKPLVSYGNCSDKKYATDKNEAVVTGTNAKLIATASGDTLYKNNKIDKVVVNHGSASAHFIFKIPSGCLPTYGGRIHIYPIWHLLGQYIYCVTTWDVYPDYMAELLLFLATAAYTYNGKSEAKKTLLERDSYNLLTGHKCEWNKMIKHVDYSGPSVQLDVLTGKDVYVVVMVQLYCKAGGNPYFGNIAKLDFSSFGNKIELEELRVITLKSNPPPPPPLYWEGYDKEKTLLDRFPKINPGVLSKYIDED